jgi:urease alpha subunit
LVWRVRYELSRLRPAMRNDLKSAQTKVRKRAESIVADKIVHSLRGLEILSSAPLTEGRELFSRAAYSASAQPMMGHARDDG